MFPENLIQLWKERVNVDEAKRLESKLRGHRARLGNLESRRERLLELYLDEKMEKEFLRKQEHQLKQEIERMREEIKELEDKLSEMGAMRERLAELKGMVQEVKKVAPALKQAIKRMTKKQLREFIESALAGEKIEESNRG